MNAMKHLPAALTLAFALLFVFYTDWAKALLSSIALAFIVAVGLVAVVLVRLAKKSKA